MVARTVHVVRDEDVKTLPWSPESGWYLLFQARKYHYFGVGTQVSMCRSRNWESDASVRTSVDRRHPRACQTCAKNGAR